MPFVQAEFEHDRTTQRNQLRYEFTPKHHGRPVARDDSQWEPSLAFPDEFSIFDQADLGAIVDSKGRMFGVLRSPEGELLEIGTREEQMAKFPSPRGNRAWHGFPCWAVNESGPSNRRKQKMYPPKLIFRLLREAGLITEEQMDRLAKGDHA